MPGACEYVILEATLIVKFRNLLSPVAAVRMPVHISRCVPMTFPLIQPCLVPSFPLYPQCSTTSTLRTHRTSKKIPNSPLNATSPTMASDEPCAMVPEQLISRETLDYVGFSTQMADKLWSGWTAWPSDGGPLRETDPDDGGLCVTFIDYITSPFYARPYEEYGHDGDWRRALQQFGLSAEVQDAILDPRFEYLRRSDSCASWAKDTVGMRYAGLSAIHRARSSEREGDIVRRDTQPQESPETSTTSSSIGTRSESGRTILFKAIDMARADGLLDHTGSIDMIQRIYGGCPSDFSGTRAIVYLSTDYKVAEYHAAFAKRRANLESVAIMAVSILDTEIEQLKEPEVLRVAWPSSEWKHLVWNSRKGRSARTEGLRKFKDAKLIIGSTARRPDVAFKALDSWEDVTEEFVFQTSRFHPDGTDVPVTQFVFGEDGDDILYRAQVTITAFTSADLKAYLGG